MTQSLKTALDLARDIAAENRIDPDRIYVTGQSMGGYATWYSILARPDFFAAAVPVCGGGDPSAAEQIKNLPVWAFHGADDKTVPPKGSQDMVERLKALGAPVKYTEFPGVGHLSMTQAWAEPALIPWLFQQKKLPTHRLLSLPGHKRSRRYRTGVKNQSARNYASVSKTREKISFPAQIRVSFCTLPGMRSLPHDRISFVF